MSDPGDGGTVAKAARASTSTGHLLQGGHRLLVGVIDQLIDRFGSGVYEAAIAATRKEYDQRRGRVFEDEDLWESWTQAFLEWYVVERPLSQPPAGPGAGPEPVTESAARPGAAAQPARAPVAVIAAEATAANDVERAAAARAWLRSHRSLFEVRALRAGQVELLDLLGGGQFSVSEKRAMIGVSVGDVAEMRLVGFAGEVLFGRTFCFHPPGTRDAILAHSRTIRGQGGSRRDVMDYCASLRIRCERYRHVTPVRLYESHPPGGDLPGPGAGDKPSS